MKQRTNVTDLMAQYAAELGEDLDDIEPEINEQNAFDDDPEMLKIQKQLGMAQMKNDQKIGKPATKVDELDQMLSQYEQPKKKVDEIDFYGGGKPVQQQAAKGGSGNDLISIERSISNPSDLQSLSLLRFEIGFVNQNILPNMKKNKELFEFYRSFVLQYSNQVLQLKEQQNSLIQKIKEEKIDASKYQKLVSQTFEQEQKKFKTQKGTWKDRIGLRCKTLFQELDLLKKNQFEKIAKEFGCAPDRTQQFLFEEFDQKPFLQKAQELFKRHKQWLNLTQYLSKNMRDERKEQIDDLIKKLEISKGFQEQLKQGKNISFSKFFLNEFQEITEDQFLGMNKIEFTAQVRAMADQVNQAQKEENLYYKIASVAKPIIQQVPGSKQLVKVSPGDISKQYLARYEQILKYLEDLKKESWTPLPILKIDNEQRQISTDNRDVPLNTLRVQFKNMVKGGKLYLTYSINLGNQQYQGKTEPADSEGQLNYVQDINLKDYKNCMKDLHLSKIDVKAFKKGFFSSDLKGETSISLSELLEMSTIENSTMLNGIALTYCIQMRESINKKKSVTVATIVKTFPKFNIDEGMDAYLEQKLKEIPSEPIVEKKPEPQPPQQQPQPPQQQPQPQQQQEEEQEEDQTPKLTADKLIAIIHQDDDEEFQKVKEYAEKTPQIKEEFLYPENPVNGSVFYFLVQYTDFIQKKSIEFKQIPQMKMQARFTQRLWEDCLRQKMKLQKTLEDDIEGYKINLSKVIKKDQLFIKLYKQIKAETWAKFVEGRLEIALQEQQALSEM